MSQKKKFGLVLGSGGARGAAHVGFIKALEEEGIKPDYITGCSMGSVVGACYANGMTSQEMEQAILSLKTLDIMDLGLGVFSQLGLLASNKLKNVLTKYLGDRTFEQLQIPFRCVASDVIANELVEFSSGPVVRAVQASSSIPGLFRPVKVDDKLLVDGGVLCRVPVQQVKDMGAEVVVAIDVLANTSQPIKEVPDLIQLMLRVFDMMDNASSQKSKVLNRDICDLYLEPEMKNISQYVVKNLDVPMQEGYDLAKANMAKIKQLIGIE